MVKVILNKVNKPLKSKKFSEQIEWICSSLGFIQGRDIEKTSVKIVCELLKGFKKEPLLSSEELSKKLHIDQARINHHLRKLVDSGFLIRRKRKVGLRGGSIFEAISELKREADAIFDDILEISKEIDRKLFGL